jgi:hypothetical protein
MASSAWFKLFDHASAFGLRTAAYRIFMCLCCCCRSGTRFVDRAGQSPLRCLAEWEGKMFVRVDLNDLRSRTGASRARRALVGDQPGWSRCGGGVADRGRRVRPAARIDLQRTGRALAAARGDHRATVCVALPPALDQPLRRSIDDAGTAVLPAPTGVLGCARASAYASRHAKSLACPSRIAGDDRSRCDRGSAGASQPVSPGRGPWSGSRR